MAATARKPPRAAAKARPQIAEDLRFQHRSWAAERIGWSIMAAVILAALAGLFSGGPLSRAAAEDPAGQIRIEHQRFLRHKAPSVLRIRLGAAVPDGPAALFIPHAYLDRVAIERIDPPPLRAAAGPDGLVLTFGLADPGRPAGVTLTVRPQAIGPLEARIGAPGRPPARLRQFVFP